jgi:hypothetical protein
VRSITLFSHYTFIIKKSYNYVIYVYVLVCLFVIGLEEEGRLIYLSLPYLGGVISAPDKYRRRSNTDNKEAKPFFRFAGKRTAKGFCGICVPFFVAFVFYYVCACMSIFFTSTYTSLFFLNHFSEPLLVFSELLSQLRGPSGVHVIDRDLKLRQPFSQVLAKQM